MEQVVSLEDLDGLSEQLSGPQRVQIMLGSDSVGLEKGECGLVEMVRQWPILQENKAQLNDGDWVTTTFMELSFDLNIECQQQGFQGDVGEPEGASGVTTKAKEPGNTRTVGWGVPRFAVPLKKALLCNPPPKSKVPYPKRVQAASSSCSVDRRIARQASEGTAGRSVEVRASLLLMDVVDVPEEERNSGVPDHTTLASRFVEPMQSSLVGGLRNAFGLSEEGSSDLLGPIAINAEA
jgi:hypothetical protein